VALGKPRTILLKFPAILFHREGGMMGVVKAVK
jgi:hypothetical protein